MFRYPNIIKLNNVQLTDETRGPLQEDRDERSVVITLASGKKKKWIQDIRKKWSLQWENVAMNSTHTVDLCGGRNELRAIAQLGTEVALLIQDGENTDENYTVYVESYSENLISRRSNTFRYSIQLNLEEVG